MGDQEYGGWWHNCLCCLYISADHSSCGFYPPDVEGQQRPMPMKHKACGFWRCADPDCMLALEDSPDEDHSECMSHIVPVDMLERVK
jgi:hypothetical protein